MENIEDFQLLLEQECLRVDRTVCAFHRNLDNTITAEQEVLDNPSKENLDVYYNARAAFYQVIKNGWVENSSYVTTQRDPGFSLEKFSKLFFTTQYDDRHISQFLGDLRRHPIYTREICEQQHPEMVPYAPYRHIITRYIDNSEYIVFEVQGRLLRIEGYTDSWGDETRWENKIIEVVRHYQHIETVDVKYIPVEETE